MSSVRTINASLWQNLGTGQLGASFDMAGRLISVGQLSWSADERLTKVSPGDITLQIEDNDGALWTFVQDQIAITTGLLPPFLLVDVDGVRRFLGVVNPKGLRQVPKTREVEITGQDWSILLANMPLEGSAWERSAPGASTNRDSDSTLYGGHSTTKLSLFVGLDRDFVYFDLPGNWIQLGDSIDSSAVAGGPWKVTQRDEIPFTLGSETTTHVAVKLNGFQWPNPGHDLIYWSLFHPYEVFNADFSRVAATSDPLAYYKVTEAITVDNDNPVSKIALDTVDGIAPGDTLGLILTNKSTSFTVMNIDAERNWVITRDPVSQDLAINDKLYFSLESTQELVFEDARRILARACSQYACDLSRFIPAVLPDPVLAWLPLRPSTGDDLHAVADVEPGLTDLRVFAGDGTAWDGSPETGWAAIGEVLGPGWHPIAPSKRAVWTGQTTTPPSSLMPDETANLNDLARRRNRAYAEWKYLKQDNGTRGAGEWTTALGAQAGLVVVHDYLQMRRLKCTGTAVVANAWDGSSWGADSSLTWTGGAILSACVMPGLPGALLARTAAGLELGLGYSGTCALPTAAANGVLTTTPWGAYLVSAQGYGRVDWTGSGITLRWVTLKDQVTAFYANTLAGITQDEVVMLGRFDAADRTGKTVTETYFFRLAALPVEGDALASVIWSEKVTAGAPTLVGCFRDPLKRGRVIGQLGGRLFQVDRQLPFTLERFKPTGMNAMELIEHVCQLHNAIAVPDANGVLQVVSRTLLDQVHDITVERVSRKITRVWEHFYSIIRVSTTDDEEYADALGQDGGKLMEVARHPMVWTKSGCAAMAKSWALWFGKPRMENVEGWFSSNTAAAPPWEALPKVARVRVNGAAATQRLMEGQENLKTREMTATLVDVGRSGYGIGYGREQG